MPRYHVTLTDEEGESTTVAVDASDIDSAEDRAQSIYPDSYVESAWSVGE